MLHLPLSPQLELTETQKQKLRSTHIDYQQPGSLLRDFATFLAFVDEMAPPVTGMHVLPLKALEPLNARLTQPLQHGLSRPQQKSFPHINGLFWLARATGLTMVDATGKKPRLILDEATHASWQTLNPTEQYCTLLETWVVRAQSDIIGERDAFGWNRVIEYWDEFFRRVPENGVTVAGNPDLEQTLSYYPGYHNLALLELFGFVQVQHAAPVTGKGWRIQLVQRAPLGDALLVPIRRFIYGDPNDRDASRTIFRQYDRASEVPIGALQPSLQPYFPAWQKNLVLDNTEFQDGLYIFKVALEKALWRRIAIPGQAHLEDLSDAILAAYQFDNDHLHEFLYTNRYGGQDAVRHAYLEEPPFTHEVRIGDLPLRIGMTMTYHFDFGDNWRFAVTLERIDPIALHQQEAHLIEAQGQAPEQYPNNEDEEWEDTEEEAE